MISLPTSKTRTIDRVMPVFSIESNQYILQDGRVAIGFAVSGVEAEKPTMAHLDFMHHQFHGSLKMLPEGAIIQTFSGFYEQQYTSDIRGKSYFEEKTINYYNERTILNVDMYLFISIGQDDNQQHSPLNTFYALGKSVTQNPFQHIDKLQQKIERVASDFIRTLSLEEITFTRLKDDDLKKIALRYFNLELNPRFQPTNALRGFAAESTHLAIGEKRVNVISMSGQGSPIEPFARNKNGVICPWLFPLSVNLYFPHILSVAIRICKQEKKLSTLDSKAKIMGNLSFFMTQDNLIERNELLEFTEEIRAEKDLITDVNVSVILFSSDAQQQETYIQETVAAFKSCGGSECFIENVDTASLFLSCFPGNANQGYQWLMMSARNATMYLSFNNNYINQLEGDLLCDRQGTPLLVNLFNTRLSNQNAVAVGPTGSGKSFTQGWFMLQRYNRGEPQIVIDAGGTYKSLSLALGIKYYEYDPENPLKINPFLLPRRDDGTYILDAQKSIYLITLIKNCWKGTKEDIRQVELAILTDLVKQYYDRFNATLIHAPKSSVSVPKIAGFYQFIIDYMESHSDDAEYQKQRKSFDFDELLLCLRPFAVGQYKEIMNADEYEDLAGNLMIVFDIKNIKKNKMLYPIVAMMITEITLDQMQRYPKIAKWVYLDEAWSMLESMSEYVEEMYRTIRKAFGSITIITQTVYEIRESRIGEIIINNSSTKYILWHEVKDMVKPLCQYLSFTTHEMEKIMSLKVSDTARELFIKQGDYGKVYQLEVAPEPYAVLTSRAHERETLRDLTAKYNGNIFPAINEFVNLKKLGLLKPTQS